MPFNERLKVSLLYALWSVMAMYLMCVDFFAVLYYAIMTLVFMIVIKRELRTGYVKKI
jgi:hypothetical protein